MTQKKVNGRPKKLKPSVRRLIAEKAIKYLNMDRRLLALELIDEINAAGEIPPTEETAMSYISRDRSRYKIDETWNSASLIYQTIAPDVLQCLIWIQIYRKRNLSKQLSTREARWFNNLSGIRQNYSFIPVTVSSDLKNTFLIHVTATWAQIYAYREKIDDIVNVKDPNYSDLDEAMVTGDLRKLAALNEYQQDFVFDDKWKGKYLIPYYINQIRTIEIGALGHSLGDPDMLDSAIGTYAASLVTIFNDTEYSQRFNKLLYLPRMGLLLLLRQNAKEHPNEEATLIKAKISKILDNVEKENIKTQAQTEPG